MAITGTGDDSSGRATQTTLVQARAILLLWGPVLLWAAAIFYVSSQNTWTVIQGPPISQAIRKSAHIWEYMLLALLVGRALRGTWVAGGSEVTQALMLRVWRAGTLLCAVYAATDEIHQSFVPRREFHLTDILIDTLAALAALGICYIVFIERRKEKA